MPAQASSAAGDVFHQGDSTYDDAAAAASSSPLPLSFDDENDTNGNFFSHIVSLTFFNGRDIQSEIEQPTPLQANGVVSLTQDFLQEFLQDHVEHLVHAPIVVFVPRSATATAKTATVDRTQDSETANYYYQIDFSITVDLSSSSLAIIQQEDGNHDLDDLESLDFFLWQDWDKNLQDILLQTLFSNLMSNNPFQQVTRVERMTTATTNNDGNDDDGDDDEDDDDEDDGDNKMDKINVFWVVLILMGAIGGPILICYLAFCQRRQSQTLAKLAHTNDNEGIFIEKQQQDDCEATIEHDDDDDNVEEKYNQWQHDDDEIGTNNGNNDSGDGDHYQYHPRQPPKNTSSTNTIIKDGLLFGFCDS